MLPPSRLRSGARARDSRGRSCRGTRGRVAGARRPSGRSASTGERRRTAASPRGSAAGQGTGGPSRHQLPGARVHPAAVLDLDPLAGAAAGTPRAHRDHAQHAPSVPAVLEEPHRGQTAARAAQLAGHDRPREAQGPRTTENRPWSELMVRTGGRGGPFDPAFSLETASDGTARSEPDRPVAVTDQPRFRGCGPPLWTVSPSLGQDRMTVVVEPRIRRRGPSLCTVRP